MQTSSLVSEIFLIDLRQATKGIGAHCTQQKMEHTIPFLMSLDESMDIGMDTRTPVDESYTLPFRFGGTIDKLTYKLGPEELTADQRQVVKQAIAAAQDTPLR